MLNTDDLREVADLFHSYSAPHLRLVREAADEIDADAKTIEALRNENAGLRTLLRQVEWDCWGHCNFCQFDPHDADCEFVRLLGVSSG